MGSFLYGVKDILPILIGVAPFGVLYGVTSSSAGLSKLQSVLMSSIIFAGASQIVLVDQILNGTPFVVTIFVMFLINLRMALYSVSMAPHLKKENVFIKIFGSYLLTDEAYAVSANKFHTESTINKMHYYFGAALSLWLIWQISTIFGVFLGDKLPKGVSLDFAIPLTFLALLVNFLSKKRFVVAAFVTGIMVIIFRNLPYNIGFFIGVFSGIAAGTIYSRIKNEQV